MAGRSRGLLAVLAAALITSVWGASFAQATTIADSGVTVDLTAEVRTASEAPVAGTLTVRGSLTSPTERTQLPALGLIELGLGRLALDRQGLATCTLGKLTNVTEAQARKNCGKALVGTVLLDTENTWPELVAPEPHRYRLLLFNGKAGKLLTYAFFFFGEAPAALVTTGTADRGTLRIRLPRLALAGVKAFQLRIGRTWQTGGKPHSYLSGKCSGQLPIRTTLQFSPRATPAGTVPAGCTR
jgi:hypothetical protein